MRYKEIYDDFYIEKDGKCRCKYYDECKKSYCEKCHISEAEFEQINKGFDSDLATRVGEEYDNVAIDDTPIKVMFIGKEGVNKHTAFEKPSNCDANPHYRRTIVTIMKILGEADENNALEIEKEIKMDNTFEKVKKYSQKFCLTNFYKCAFKLKSGNSDVKNSSTQDRNCAGLIIREIEALAPTIIIKQGKFAVNKFDKELLKKYDFVDNGILYNDKNIAISAYKYTHKKTKATLYIIYSYHPTARGIVAWQYTYKSLFKAIDEVKADIKSSQA